MPANGIPRIPRALSELADRLGVRFVHADRGLIAPDESRELYLRLTPFSFTARDRVRELSRRGALSVERVCYLVHHGVWSAREMELLLLGSPYPDLILGRSVVAEQRHLHAQSGVHARGAVLAGVLHRALAYRDPLAAGADRVVHDGEPRALRATVRDDLFAQVYEADEPLELRGWLLGGEEWRVPPGTPFTALLRPWTRAALRSRLPDELATFAGAALPRPAAVVVPFDFHALAADERERIVDAARRHDIAILVCPEKLAALSSEAARRLLQGRNVRK